MRLPSRGAVGREDGQSREAPPGDRALSVQWWGEGGRGLGGRGAEGQRHRSRAQASRSMRMRFLVGSFLRLGC
jgi:hypothetical protein